MSGTDPSVREALRWLRFSGEDLSAAQVLTRKTPALRHACWLCRQAAEGALKAALVYEGIDFPRTQDLDVLQNLLPDGWAVQEAHHGLSELTEWADGTMYPSDRPEPTRADAARMELKARSVYNSVTAEFKRRGMDD